MVLNGRSGELESLRVCSPRCLATATFVGYQRLYQNFGVSENSKFIHDDGIQGQRIILAISRSRRQNDSDRPDHG